VGVDDIIQLTVSHNPIKLAFPMTIESELKAVTAAVGKATNEWESRFVFGETADTNEASKEYVEYLLRVAHLTVMSFLDRNNLPHLGMYLEDKWGKHKDNLLESYMSEFAEQPLLTAVGVLSEVIEAVKNTFSIIDAVGDAKSIADVVSIMNQLPSASHLLSRRFQNEGDLDTLAEAILITVFPDLNSNPSLTIPVSSRHPDSAIPARHLLLEYKFISEKKDIRRVIDEMQADVRNYAQDPWRHLVFVVGQNEPYTTKEQLQATIGKEPTTFDSIVVVVVTHNPRAQSKNESSPAQTPMS